MSFWKKHLTARLAGFFLLLSLTTVSIVGYVAYMRAREALSQAAVEHLETVANIKKDEFNGWLNEQRRNLVFITWLPEFRKLAGAIASYPAGTPEYQDAYQTLSRHLSYIVTAGFDSTEYLVLDLNGEVAVSTDKANEGLSYADTSYFTRGQTRLVEHIYVSPKTGKPTITIANPLFNDQDRSVGVMVTHLDLARVDRLIQEDNRPWQDTESYLVDKNRIFVSADFLLDKQQYPNGVFSEGIDSALQGKNGFGLYTNYAGMPVIGVYRWMGNQEIALVTEISQEEAFAPARRLALTILLIGSGSVLLLTFGTYLLVRQVSLPIKALTNAATRLAEGDLNEVAPVMTEDEVGVLACAFNKMTEQLLHAQDETIEELEKKVEERTAELITARDAAEAASRFKSVFLSNMSHEIRTPMNAMIGFCQLMKSDISLTGKQREYVEIINRSGEHLLGLINVVLEMSKIEAGRVGVNLGNIDLQAMFHDIEAMFRIRVEAKNLSLLVDVSEDVPRYATTDEGKLRQILINLMGNAVKFTSSGGISVRARSGDECRRLIVEVEDTGPGMNGKECDRLFQAFEQTEAGANAGGTGLGLALSREYARLLGGDVTVRSEVGRGSCFHVELDISACEKGMIDSTSPSRHIIGLEAGGMSCRVLVADDRMENRMLVRELLTPIGFDVREAENGVEAVAKFEECAPHIVLMDLRMPVLDGCDATRRIKSTEPGQSTPIIMLTASAFEDERRRVLNSGADGYLRKPFRDYELFSLLAKHANIQYCYEDSPADGPGIDGSSEAHPTTESIDILPDELVEQILSAITNLDFDYLMELIDRASMYVPQMAERMRAMAIGFQFDELSKLLRKGA